MTVTRFDHVGIVVTDIAAATEFFLALGLKLQGKAVVGGAWVDRVIGLEDVESEIAMLETPDGSSMVELSQFRTPLSPESGPHPPSNELGIRHLSFVVDDVDADVARLRELGAELVGEIEEYRDIYRLCYIRGPEGIIIELAEPLS